MIEANHISPPIWDAMSHPDNVESLDELAFPTEKLKRHGEIAVMYAGWGNYYTNQEMQDLYVKKTGQQLKQKQKDMMDNLGFDGGYRFDQEHDPWTQESQDHQVVYAARLAQKVAQARGWKHIDTLRVASISSWDTIAERTAQLLEENGITVGNVQFYDEACNGGIAGVINACREEAAKDIHEPHNDEKVVVVGVDSLSGRAIPIEDLQSFATFGNGGGAIAFVPGKDIEWITGKTVITHDPEGVIKVPNRGHGLPDKDEQIALPPHHYYADGSQEEEVFAHSSHGLYKTMPLSDDGHMSMNGSAAYKFFSRTLTPLIWNMLVEEYEAQYSINGIVYPSFRELYGPLAVPISHMPSYPVIIGISRELARQFAQRALERINYHGNVVKVVRDLSKLTKSERIDRLEELGVSRDTYYEIEIPWMMNNTSMDNVSAGVSFVSMTEMIDQGRVEMDVPTPIIGFGIGSVEQADVVIFRDARREKEEEKRKMAFAA